MDVKIGRRKEIKRAAEGEESNKHNIWTSVSRTSDLWRLLHLQSVIQLTEANKSTWFTDYFLINIPSEGFSLPNSTGKKENKDS